MTTRKVRLDDLLVSRGSYADRASALRGILAGDVRVGGETVTRPAVKVPSDADVSVRAPKRFVSRGGEKLEGAFAAFDIDVEGLSCLDCGASTGGFTDCLLQHGAAHVTAVDVGYGQFAWSLRCDPRVTLLERTNLHDLAPDTEGAPFDLAVADMSFCPLSSYIGCAANLLKKGGGLLVLVKPQFEVARSQVGDGGVVRESSLHVETLERAVKTFNEAGFGVVGLEFSPITGPAGNIEYLVFGVGGIQNTALDIPRIVTRSHARLDRGCTS